MFKIRHPADRILVSSDFHYKHDKPFIWQDRGFFSREGHDNHIESLIHKAPDDSYFIHNGDLALNASQVQVDWLLEQINLKFKHTFFNFGNHEHHVRTLLTKKSYSRITFSEYSEFNINGTEVCAMHYPIAVWNKKHHGSIMLCGHAHGKHVESTPRDVTSKILDVGIDTHPDKGLWDRQK